MWFFKEQSVFLALSSISFRLHFCEFTNQFELYIVFCQCLKIHIAGTFDKLCVLLILNGEK